MKLVHALVTNCGSCPFLDVVHVPVVTQDQGTFAEGWFCLHKARREYVLRQEDSNGLSLRAWLVVTYGEPFPPDCPLPDTVRAARPTGRRDLDLQPVVRA